MSLIAIDQVARLLAAQAASIAQELLPLGSRQGRNWVDASTAKGGLGDSMMVEISGPQAGRFKHFGANVGGDMIDLVAYVRFGGEKAAALAWGLDRLGLRSANPEQMETARREAEARARRAQAAAEAKAALDGKRAQALWLRGVAIAGTPVEAYLRTRGIDLRVLSQMPSALRYVAELHCTEIGATLPGMVAMVLRPVGGGFLTVHRTWLGPLAGTWASPLPAHQAGGWGKAALQEPKKAYSSYLGGFIPLSRGASGRRWAEMRGNETVALAEGIETALSVAVLMPEWRVAATVSLGNMGALAIPPAWRRVVVCADRDRPDSAAAETLPKVLRHLASQGAEVLVIEPDEGFKDWNDQLRAELAEMPAPAQREARA